MDSNIDQAYELKIKLIQKRIDQRMIKLESKFNLLKEDLYNLTKEFKTNQHILNAATEEESLSNQLEAKAKSLIIEEREVKIVIL